MEIVVDMGIGINLGNTFESSGDWIRQWGDGTPNSYETAWGSPTITQAMIQGYADEGFGALRVPVAWSNMMRSLEALTLTKAEQSVRGCKHSFSAAHSTKCSERDKCRSG